MQATEKNGVILKGSSRSAGNTGTIVAHVADRCGFDVIDLSEKEIGRFDYDFRNRNDDYLPLMRQIIENYRTIVFATPVYWYSMSGIMKDFFDRITDLLRADKELGRRLRGMSMAMISCGSDQEIPEYFKGPFKDSADYLGMNYLGEVHTWVEDGEVPVVVREEIQLFIEKLQE